MRRLLLAFAAVATVVPLAATPAAASEATLTCFPLAPADIRYDNTWGAARSGGRGHQGTDIMAPKQTVVMAVAGGVVETMDTASGAGYYVRLVHRGGWETWYMHLDNDSPGTDDGSGGAGTAYAEGLEVGDRVVAGQVIGYVGDSGNAEWTGSHLHFELHVGGGPVNPYHAVLEAEERIERLRRHAEPAPLEAVAAAEDAATLATVGTSDMVARLNAADRVDAACLHPSLHPNRAVAAARRGADLPLPVDPVAVRVS
jgi:murein DD-endopeptidase MepM/ murein hydrolase activator NlpD